MTLAQIRALAEEYARQYNAEQVAPFPVKNILEEHKDLDIYYVDMEDDNVSGATLFKDGRYSILINITKSERRQHFALGHELGHYFLHQDQLQKEGSFIDADGDVNPAHIHYSNFWGYSGGNDNQKAYPSICGGLCRIWQKHDWQNHSQ